MHGIIDENRMLKMSTNSWRHHRPAIRRNSCGRTTNDKHWFNSNRHPLLDSNSLSRLAFIGHKWRSVGHVVVDAVSTVVRDQSVAGRLNEMVDGVTNRTNTFADGNCFNGVV